MKAFIRWVDRHAWKILWGLMFTVFCGLTLIALWKFQHYYYNVLDLAIFNQVFFSSANGNLFGYSIHQDSYLGDHFAITLLAFIPIYKLISHPLTLVFLQIGWLVTGAIPLFLLTRGMLSKQWALGISTMYLASPFIHSMALFEFHMLTLAIPLVFWLMLAYTRKRYWVYLLLVFLLVLTREDVALSMAFFAILPFLEKRGVRWWLPPLVLGAGWFLATMQLAPVFNGCDGYKFSIYYGWLGSSFGDILHTVIFELNTIFAHVFRPDNFLYTVAILISFAFLPFLRFRYLLPAVPIFAQALLSGPATGTMALIRHYPALLIAWCFVATSFAVAAICASLPPGGTSRIIKTFRNNQGLVALLLLTVSLYGFFTLSPFAQLAYKALSGEPLSNPLKPVHNEFLPAIEPSDVVVSTDSTITQLSSRERVYPLFYIWVNQRQYCNQPYTTGPIDRLYLDSTQIRELYHHFSSIGDEKSFMQGDENLRELIAKNQLALSHVREQVVVFTRGASNEIEPYHVYEELPEIQNERNVPIHPAITFHGWDTTSDGLLSLFFESIKSVQDHPFLRIEIINGNGEVVRSGLYPLAYGLYPAEEWKPGSVVQLNYVIPRAPTEWIRISFVEIPSGTLQIDEARGISIQDETYRVLGKAMDLK